MLLIKMIVKNNKLCKKYNHKKLININNKSKQRNPILINLK